jgi:hypothetical protein
MLHRLFTEGKSFRQMQEECSSGAQPFSAGILKYFPPFIGTRPQLQLCPYSSVVEAAKSNNSPRDSLSTITTFSDDDDDDDTMEDTEHGNDEPIAEIYDFCPKKRKRSMQVGNNDAFHPSKHINNVDLSKRIALNHVKHNVEPPLKTDIDDNDEGRFEPIIEF